MTFEELQTIFQSPIRVCKEHRDSLSRDCAVCKLEEARNEMLQTFWYVSACCVWPRPAGGITLLPWPPDMAPPLRPPPPPVLTNEQAMKEVLDHIVEISDTMVDRYGNPDGSIKPWPRPGSK